MKKFNLSDKDILDLAYGESKAILRVQKKIERQKAKKPIKISSRKAKGRGWEQTVAKKIAELIGCKYGTDDNALVSYRSMGQSGTDVILRGEALNRFPFMIETKAQESINLKGAWEQTMVNAKGGLPMLCIKNKSLGEVYILTWEGIEELYYSLFGRN